MFYLTSKPVHNFLFEAAFLCFIGNYAPAEFDDEHTLPA
jgi:hypothetical protein